MSDHQLGDRPIDPQVREIMKWLARGIDDVLNGDGPKKNGFILMTFPLEGRKGRCNYISSADRADVVVLLKEQLAHFEGQPEASGRG